MDLLNSKNLNLMNYNTAKTILHNARLSQDWKLGWFYGNKLCDLFPLSYIIKDETSIAAFYCKEYVNANKIINELIDLSPPESMIHRIMNNKFFCIPYLIKNIIKDQPTAGGYEHESHSLGHISRNRNIAENYAARHVVNSPFSLVFKNTNIKTITSFFSQCCDLYLFSKFYYIYDNFENICLIKNKFPMIQCFKFKTNILSTLQDQLTPYFFYIENDWIFFDKFNFITYMVSILETYSTAEDVIKHNGEDVKQAHENITKPDDQKVDHKVDDQKVDKVEDQKVEDQKVHKVEDQKVDDRKVDQKVDQKVDHKVDNRKVDQKVDDQKVDQKIDLPIYKPISPPIKTFSQVLINQSLTPYVNISTFPTIGVSCFTENKYRFFSIDNSHCNLRFSACYSKAEGVPMSQEHCGEPTACNMLPDLYKSEPFITQIPSLVKRCVLLESSPELHNLALLDGIHAIPTTQVSQISG